MRAHYRFGAALALLLIGCNSNGGGDAGIEPSMDAGIEPSMDAGSEPSMDAGSECDPMLQYGDLRDPDDHCWAPPENYCSAGAGAEDVTACSPDGDQCCRRPDRCVPCGWVICADEPEACPAEAEIEELVNDNNEECAVLERPFCPSEFTGGG